MMRAKVIFLLLCLAFLLVGCGNNSGVTDSSQTPSPTSTRPDSGHATPSPSGATPVTGKSTPPTASITPGPDKSTPSPSVTPGTEGVQVQVSASVYQTTDTIVVTISNASPSPIVFADHQTNCTVVLLQRQVGSSWESFSPCKLMTLTRRLTLEAGKQLTVSLKSGLSARPVGSYRITFRYSEQTGNANGLALNAYSPVFLIAAK